MACSTNYKGDSGGLFGLGRCSYDHRHLNNLGDLYLPFLGGPGDDDRLFDRCCNNLLDSLDSWLAASGYPSY